jgi:putative sigma-54 modulation protein
MKIRIHSHHFTVSDELDKYIQEKFSSLAQHDQGITNIEVTLLVQNKLAKAEANIHVPKANIFASSENEEMVEAINHLIKKLDRQIKKHKEKNKKIM